MTKRISAGSRLERLLRDTGLVVVDIGARRGPGGELRALAEWAHLIAVEPDTAEADRLAATLGEDGWRDVSVAPVAVGTPGRATLHVTASPGFSSLLPPDPKIAGRYANSDNFRITARDPIDVVALDDVTHDVNLVTMLKLDTQGTELDILRSGEETVARTAAVLVEALFEPMYSGQPLFGDVDRHLRERGFRLGDLTLARLRGNGFRAELWSRRQAAWAHAVYIRDPLQVDLQLVPHLLAATLALDFADVALQLTEAHLPDLAADVEAAAAARTKKIVTGLTPADTVQALSAWERA